MTSLLDASVLRQLVRVYLSSNPPKTADDFNFQAELKAVSHWRWLKDSEEAEFVQGPHHDPRLKEAADFVLETWEGELPEQEIILRQQPSLKKKKKMGEGIESSSDDIIRGGRFCGHFGFFVNFYCTLCHITLHCYIIFLSRFFFFASRW